MEHALKVMSKRLRRRLSLPDKGEIGAALLARSRAIARAELDRSEEGVVVSQFPRVVWQKGCERVVQKDHKTLTVEVSHRNALGDENWMPALPDAAQDAIGQALLDRLNEDEQ